MLGDRWELQASSSAALFKCLANATCRARILPLIASESYDVPARKSAHARYDFLKNPVGSLAKCLRARPFSQDLYQSSPSLRGPAMPIRVRTKPGGSPWPKTFGLPLF